MDDYLYVITLAEEKNFSKAASRLYISQSALSQAIKRIESEIGLKLFVRHTGIFEPTPAGKIIIQYGNEILHNDRELKQKLIHFSESYTLNLGVGSFGAKYYLPVIVHDFSSKFPNISVQISKSNSAKMQKAILNGQLDIGLLHSPILYDDEIEFSPLFDEHILLAVPYDHHLSQKYGISTKSDPININLADAANEQFIFWKKSERFGQRSIDFCTEAGFIPNVVIEIMDFEAINALVACGMGLGFITDKTPDVPSGNRPNYYTFNSKSNIRSYGVAYHKKSIKKNIINVYIDIAKNALKDI